MFTRHLIASLDAPELAPYRTMRRPVEHVRQGIFVAEGEKVVRRLLQDTRFEVVSVLLPDKWLAAYEPLLAAHPQTIPVFTAESRLLEQLVGFHLYQGVLAVGRIPPPPTVASLLAGAPRPRLFVAADGLSNAENIGVLVRNCAAFSVQGLLVGETCASPWLRRAVRNSMGNIFQVPIVETAALLDALRLLQSNGVRLVAAHPHTEQTTLAATDLTGDCCLVLGSEGDGLRPEVLAACDVAAAIPMPPTVDSMNVTSAAAVFLYEAARQRGQMGTRNRRAVR
ncbi:MAG: TrmH family RNA methyltransferase [Limisphaerales bacterium]